MAQEITVQSSIEAPLDLVWKCYTEPEHVMRWNAASDDWHTPQAKNDLRPDGTFVYRMEAKDGSVGFDFGGTYTAVEQHERIAYVMDDGRKVEVHFVQNGPMTNVTVRFDPEQINARDMQQKGWQAILDNFKRYVEGLSSDVS